MAALKNKIDFVALISVTNANGNGDPLNGNRPRTDYNGMGEISDVCIKRKLRNRMQDMGNAIFVQSEDRCDDGFKSLSDRATAATKGIKEKETYAQTACEKWMDVRSFGQVFAFKSNDKSGVSVGVRGPVSIHQAVSLSPVDIISMQITKSVNSEAGKESKASDTMGSKHRVEFGVYKIMGSINVQLAEKTGFSQEDAEAIKEALKTLFENDASSARPEGSLEVCRMYWWQHDEKTPAVSSGKIQRGFSVSTKETISRPKKFEDYDITWHVDGCKEPEVFDFV